MSSAQDFESWNEIDLTASYGGVSFLVPLLARVSSGLESPELAATGITVDFPLHRHMIVTGGYLFAVLPQPSLSVHVPLIALTPAFHFRRLAISDRNRFEKLIGLANSPVRYRNRCLIDLSIGAKERWHAFTSNELMFNLSAGNWNQNRLQFGAGRQLTSRLFLDLYYLRRNLSGGIPTQNVLGTALRITLRSVKDIGHGADKS